MNRAELWTFPLRIISPAFVGGAEPNEPAELRAAGIRGALRAWYRLLVGPAVAAGLVASHAHLRESRLFGGTGKGEGQGLVSLSLLNPPTPGDLPWDTRTHRNRQPGLAYLGFSLDMGNNNRKAYRPGTHFALRVAFVRGVSDDDADLLLHTIALWLSLGGLGTRSRRGFGSLWLAHAPTFTDLIGRGLPKGRRGFALPLSAKGGELGASLRAMLKGCQSLRERLKLPLPEESTAPWRSAGPAYQLRLADRRDTRRSEVRLWLGARGEGWRAEQDALNDIGVRMLKKRRELGVDGVGGSPLRLLSERKLLPFAPRRVAFGAPLTLRPVGPSGPVRLGTFHLLPIREGDRADEVLVENRAPSPLLISVVPVGDRYGLAITLLSGPWPGRDVPLVVVDGSAKASARMSDGGRLGRGTLQLDPNNRLPLDFIQALPGAEDLWP
jgi:CRISPR type III-B/RAMP module RAMP protein Cmr1